MPTSAHLFGLSVPIVQAPMAGVSTPRLAAAVSNAGGLGSLGIGAASVEQARAMIAQTRSMTDKPFQVNVFCHRPAVRDAGREAAWLAHLAPLFAEYGAQAPQALAEVYESFLGHAQAMQMVLDTRPAVVSFHFGLPGAEQLAALRGAGIETMATATNLAEAQAIAAAGIDTVVAQGIEAGGHRGVFDPDAPDEALTTAELVRLLVSEIRLPVVAAGGIMTGADIGAMLRLGAAAAQLGTAFVLCPESAAHAAYRARLKSAAAAETRLTAVVSGRPARGIVNRLITHGEQPGSPPPAAYPVAYDAAKHLAAHDPAGFGAHWAGQAAALARELPAADLVALLRREMAAAAL